MGLYLMVSDGRKEPGEIAVGHYSDFALFRNTVCGRKARTQGLRYKVSDTHASFRP